MLLPDFEIAVEGAMRMDTLWSVFAGYFRGTVVSRVSYLHLPPLGAPDGLSPTIAAEGFPEVLVAEYLRERLYRANPVLQHARKEILPVYWDEIATLKPLSEQEAAFLERFQADLGNGVGIHVYGPNGRGGQCGLGFRPGVRRLDPATLREFQRVCQLVHLRYCALLAPALEPRPKLSERETQILAWVASGKSNTMIGEILGISGHTVDAHMRRIYLKLGVFDRISATVRGIGMGLIHAET